MELGKVIGTVVATRKDPKMEGMKLLIVRTIDLAGQMQKSWVVAVDTVGAGFGETVMVVKGSSARLPESLTGKPVDAAIIAIIDTVEVDEPGRDR